MTGGVIASTDSAVNTGKNSFTTGGQLTITDVQNTASYSGSGYNITASISTKTDKDGKPIKDDRGNTLTSPSGSMGIGSTQGSAASTSSGGISGIAGNQSVRTGDAETGIKPIFDAGAANRQINAGITITAAFLPQAVKAWADYADKKQKEATTAADKEAWGEGGVNRVTGHFVIGLLGGGVNGGVGALASATVMPRVGKLIDELDAPDGVKQIIGMGLSATLGSIAGPTGIATSFNVDTNNRQLHPTERQWAKDNAGRHRDYLSSKTGETISTEEAYQRLLSAGYAIVDTAAANTGKSDESAKQFINQNSGNLFVATAAERAKPLLNGNTDGSFSPEQQARYGVKTPTELANRRLEVANQVVGKNCDFYSCLAKVDAIVGAVSALEQEKALYSNDPLRVRQIEMQQNQLLSGLTKKDIDSARLAEADSAFMMDILMLPQAVGLINGVSRSVVLSRLVGRVEGGVWAKSAPTSVELTFDKGTRTWTTPAGVDYGPGSVHGNRVQHVLDHAAPNPNKTTHSVFSVDRKEVLGLVDNAWLAKGNPLPNDPGAYVVPMGRVVGTAGETSIKIIVRPGTNKIITAYPFQ